MNLYTIQQTAATHHSLTINHTKNMNTPHTFDHYSARDCAIGKRITLPFGAWLDKCERHDLWHELPDEQRVPTIENVAAFLDDYADFEEENK